MNAHMLRVSGWSPVGTSAFGLPAACDPECIINPPPHSYSTTSTDTDSFRLYTVRNALLYSSTVPLQLRVCH